jgi:hypothetical protein
MSARYYAVLLIAVMLLCSALCVAQKADAAFVVGGAFVSDPSVTDMPLCPPGPPCPPVSTFRAQTDNRVFFEGALGVRVLDAKVASLYVELPIAGIPSQTVTFTQASFGKFSSFFFTPSLRVKLLPASPIAPFFSLGGGVAHYSLFNGSSTKGALQFGGGLDFKTGIPHLGLRAEVRDFVTPTPNFSLTGLVLGGVRPQDGLNYNNVLVGGGVVFKF